MIAPAAVIGQGQPRIRTKFCRGVFINGRIVPQLVVTVSTPAIQAPARQATGKTVLIKNIRPFAAAADLKQAAACIDGFQGFDPDAAIANQ